MSKIANILKRSLPFLVFGDSWLSVLGHPYALARTGLKNSLYSLASGLPDGPLLDIGCGSMPYRDIFKSASPYHGLEIDQPRNRDNPLVDFFYDGVTLPFHDQSYSVIFSSQVLEHSFKPEQLLSECRRVLKPGGTLLLTIPFMWPEHEQPWDSQRFTSYGLLYRLKQAGFEPLSVTKTNPELCTLIQLLIELIESNIRSFLESIPLKYVRKTVSLASKVICFFPYTILNSFGIICRHIYLFSCKCNSQDRGPEMFLDMVVVARVSSSAIYRHSNP